MAHVADRLQALLSGAASPEERAQAEAHLASCAGCREERDLLASANPLIAPLPEVEPRIGFAARVAANARDRRISPFARWLRWVVGGAALGTAAVAAAIVLAPRIDRLGGENAVLAQRLDLFEDLAVVQNREALEDLEVVSVLHTLEARP
jgi:predicted anti-sigma-YlaC factor YlaD